MGTDLLILNHVELVPEARGVDADLAPLFAALMLEPLIAGVHVVACYPAPITSGMDDRRRAAVSAKLGQVWAKAGFIPLRDGVWVIDPSARHYSECWDTLFRRWGLAR
jgi:hypothetical protein